MMLNRRTLKKNETLLSFVEISGRNDKCHIDVIDLSSQRTLVGNTCREQSMDLQHFATI